MNGWKRIAPAVFIVTVFTLVFQVGFWLLILPQFQSIGKNVTTLSLYEEQERQASVGTPTPKPGSSPATAYERQVDQVNKLLPLEDKIYDLSVQVEALAKESGVELTSLQITPAQTTSTGSTGSSTTPKATPAATATPESSTNGVAASPAPAASAATTLKDSNLMRPRLSIGVAGTYETIQAFIGGLTRLQRFLTIDQVGITVGESGSYTAQITALAYSYRYAQPKP